MAHHREKESGDGSPELHWEYCFLSAEGSRLAIVLAPKEKQTKMTLSTVGPMKGGSIEVLARRVLAFLEELGLEAADIVEMKSDQGSAILDLFNNIASRRTAESKAGKGGFVRGRSRG